jgi:hypothetical protein
MVVYYECKSSVTPIKGKIKVSNSEPKPVFFTSSDKEIQQYIEYKANDLVLCILNEASCYAAYYNRIKQTTLWKNPRPLKQGSWDRLLAFCAPKLPQCKSSFKDKDIRKLAIEKLKDCFKNDCAIVERERLEESK